MSRRQITRRVTELVRKAFRDENVSFQVSRLRKHIVTSHRGWENPSVSAADFVSQMPHNIRTAESHYHVQDDIGRKARVGRYLEDSTRDTNEPSTSQQHIGMASPSSETLADRYGKQKKPSEIPTRALGETLSSFDDEAPPPRIR